MDSPQQPDLANADLDELDRLVDTLSWEQPLIDRGFDLTVYGPDDEEDWRSVELFKAYPDDFVVEIYTLNAAAAHPADLVVKVFPKDAAGIFIAANWAALKPLLTQIEAIFDLPFSRQTRIDRLSALARSTRPRPPADMRLPEAEKSDFDWQQFIDDTFDWKTVAKRLRFKPLPNRWGWRKLIPFQGGQAILIAVPLAGRTVQHFSLPDNDYFCVQYERYGAWKKLLEADCASVAELLELMQQCEQAVASAPNLLALLQALDVIAAQHPRAKRLLSADAARSYFVESSEATSPTLPVHEADFESMRDEELDDFILTTLDPDRMLASLGFTKEGDDWVKTVQRPDRPDTLIYVFQNVYRHAGRSFDIAVYRAGTGSKAGNWISVTNSRNVPFSSLADRLRDMERLIRKGSWSTLDVPRPGEGPVAESEMEDFLDAVVSETAIPKSFGYQFGPDNNGHYLWFKLAALPVHLHADYCKETYAQIAFSPSASATLDVFLVTDEGYWRFVATYYHSPALLRHSDHFSSANLCFDTTLRRLLARVDWFIAELPSYYFPDKYKQVTQWIKGRLQGISDEVNALVKKPIITESDDFDIEREIEKLPHRQVYLKQQLDAKTITHQEAVEFAAREAESVLHIWEKDFPDDKRPREAIAAAWAWWKEPTDANRKAASAAGSAAYAAAAATFAVAAAAAAAAAYAGSAAACSAYAAAAAAGYANNAAYYAAQARINASAPVTESAQPPADDFDIEREIDKLPGFTIDCHWKDGPAPAVEAAPVAEASPVPVAEAAPAPDYDFDAEHFIDVTFDPVAALKDAGFTQIQQPGKGQPLLFSRQYPLPHPCALGGLAVTQLGLQLAVYTDSEHRATHELKLWVTPYLTDEQNRGLPVAVYAFYPQLLRYVADPDYAPAGSFDRMASIAAFVDGLPQTIAAIMWPAGNSALRASSAVKTAFEQFARELNQKAVTPAHPEIEESTAQTPEYDFDIEAAIDALPDRQVYLKQQLDAKTITHQEAVEYAARSAESVLHIWEKKFPHDKRPRQAVDAAWKWWKEPTEENRKAAATAAYAAAYAAANAAASASASAAAYAATYADAAYAADAADAADATIDHVT